MSKSIAQDTFIDSAESNAAAPLKTLTTWKITALILATMTPLTVIIATLPLGLAFGGPALIFMFLVAGAIMAIFCVGYTEMARQISRPGAFYIYISRGISKPIGVGGAMLGLLGYVTGSIASYSVGSVVISQTLLSLNIDLPWYICFVLLVGFVAFMVWKQIDFSAVIGAMVVILELLFIYGTIYGLYHLNGSATFSLPMLSADIFNYGNVAVAFIFAFLVYQGIETGAMFAPEAKNPEKTIPKSIMLSLAILTFTYFIFSWVASSLSTPANLMNDVQSQEVFGYIFNAIHLALGDIGVAIFSIMSILAMAMCSVSGANFLSRFIYGLASDRLFPQYLAKLNSNAAPTNAAFTLLTIVCVSVLIATIIGLDPYTQISPIGFGITTVTTTLVMILSSVSVIGFFQYKKTATSSLFKTLIAPIIALICLFIALYIEFKGFNLITGVETELRPYVVIISLIIFISGLSYALFLKKNKAETYKKIAEG